MKVLVQKCFFSIVLLICTALPQTLRAELGTNPQIPEALKPWIDWVLRAPEDQAELCPYLQSGGESRHCAWAGALELNLGQETGQFLQTWEVVRPTQVPLPGDSEHWPQDLRVNAAPAAVFENNGRPELQLAAGRYTISGTFRYAQLPESFPIPPETGILHLKVLGQTQAFPKVESASGLVWLQQEALVEDKEDHLELRVHRKLCDEIPFQITTLITLNVSGKNREVLLKDVLFENFVAMDLNSPVPARIEADGALRIQVKPGEWRVEITSRHQGPLEKISLPKLPTPWPEEEVWVFQAENRLRLVWVEGVSSIDPQQTSLPQDWKQLPTYRVAPGETMRFVEKRRGDSDPAPDQLSLARQWWLDFDGGGYTFSDTLNGTLSRSQRLEMNPPLRLGRVSIDGQDQLITQLPGADRTGVELRLRQFNALAESRLDTAARKLPVLGWNHNFQEVRSTLQLPPGWRLFAASGVDQVQHSWISGWTLMDLFLLFITALAFAKIWGWKWGAVALFTLALLFPEFDAPKWIWLAVVLGFALLKLLPQGKLARLVQLYKWGSLLVLLLISLPFILQQVRVGVFPALEYPNQTIVASSSQTYAENNLMPTDYAPPEGALQAESTVVGKKAPAREESKLGRLNNMKDNFRGGYKNYSGLNLQTHLPGSKVQTGPGLPEWNWNSVEFSWSGPVNAGQTLRLFLWGPKLNLFLAWLRVGLLIALLFCMLPIPKFSWSRIRKGSLLGLLLLASFSLHLPHAQADFPSETLLQQLKDELLKTPECFPQCASISRMDLAASGQELRLRLEVSTQSGAAVPVPGSAKEWSPHSIVVDGLSVAGTLRSADGQLWIALPPGVHQVQLAGPLPEQERISLPLPLLPHLVSAQLQGWSLSGLREGMLPDQTLQLTRSQVSQTSEGTAVPVTVNGSAQGLKPFVQVKRRLVLGLHWSVVTEVTRLTPLGVPVVLEVPLWPGESITTPGIRVNEAKAVLSLAPQENQVSWLSTLNTQNELQLQAPESLDYMETWELEANSLWHVETNGIPPVHQDQTLAPYGLSPQWRPWPGETLSLKISRPEGVAGPTLTIDQSMQKIRPGLRHSEVELNFRLRSSLGGQHVVKLPKGAELQEVSLDGIVQPIRLEGEQLTLPIVPGVQRVKIRWQHPGGMGFWFRGPMVQLGIPSVNAEIQIEISNGRWLLWTGGPTLGPSVLFWSLLLVLLLFAIVLSRSGKTPLGALSWLLLGIGVTQFPEIPTAALLAVVGWFLLLAWRQNSQDLHAFWFNMRQLLVVAYTFFFIIILLASIHQGLLGRPEMQITGNGSSPYLLKWFQDRSGPTLPKPWVISVPLYVYRLAMLAWALWIAIALLQWTKWAWHSFASGQLWKPLGIFKSTVKSQPKR